MGRSGVRRLRRHTSAETLSTTTTTAPNETAAGTILWKPEAHTRQPLWAIL